MSTELKLRIMFHQDGGGGGGGHIREGKMIFPSPHDLGGVHFHCERLPTLEEATKLLKERHWILPDENVISLAKWGKNKKGIEGYAAVTDRMANCLPDTTGF